MINKNILPDYLKKLNPEQLKAVQHRGKSLLILAGAGSGKTRVITTKIAYFIDFYNYDPRSILAVTFTNKAAQEMRNRVLKMCAHPHKVMIKTFHSFGAWLLRKYASFLGLESSFLIYDEQDMHALVKNIIKEKSFNQEAKEIVSLISRAKNLCLKPDHNLNIFSNNQDFPLIYNHYQKRLRNTGNLDFGDLILLCIELLKNNPQVKKEVRERFSLILVDEYQDSNTAQLEFLKEMYGENTYLCVVGDDDQSIYRFRGAQVRNIIDFPDHFPGTDIIKLEENYRSTQNILNAASAVVAHNYKRHEKKLRTKNSQGEPIVWACLKDHGQEAQYCAKVLASSRYGDTAILYRMNYQSRHFEEAFSRLGIPYNVVGSQRFYEREEVKDTLSYLYLICNPRDEVAFRRIINKPIRGVGNASLSKILATQAQSNLDLLEGCSLSSDLVSPKARNGIKIFLEFMNLFKRIYDTVSLSQLIHTVIFETGLLSYYEQRDKNQGTAKCANLNELVNAALSYPGGAAGLTMFLENTMLNNPEYDNLEQGKVTLITIHNTKGLEFERVIITGLEEGVFPATPEGIDDDKIEEERRLFYVGITRAKKNLYLTSCQRRALFGRFIESRPSRFIAEIPGRLLKTSNLALQTPHTTAEDGYYIGCSVYHDDYGYGTVIKRDKSGSVLKVIVRFETGRTCQFIPKYSSLERIGTTD